MSKVALLKIDPDAKQKTIEKTINESLSMLADINTHIPIPSKLLIKPNFGTTIYEKSVKPTLFKAALSTFTEKNYKVLTGEDPAVLFI